MGKNKLLNAMDSFDMMSILLIFKSMCLKHGDKGKELTPLFRHDCDDFLRKKCHNDLILERMRVGKGISDKMIANIYSKKNNIRTVIKNVYKNPNMSDYVNAINVSERHLVNALLDANFGKFNRENAYAMDCIKKSAFEFYFWIYQCSNPICTTRRMTLLGNPNSIELKLGQRSNVLMRCKGCFTAVYCSKRCQKMHWNRYNHRQQC